MTRTKLHGDRIQLTRGCSRSSSPSLRGLSGVTTPCGTSLPALAAAADDAVDSATVSFLLQMAQKEKEEEEEELLNIHINQLTSPQRRRRAEHCRSGAAQAFLAAVTAKEMEKRKKKKKKTRSRSQTKWTLLSCSP